MSYIIQPTAAETKQYIAVAKNIQTSDFFSSQSLNTRNTDSTFSFFDLSNATNNSNVDIVKNNLSFDYSGSLLAKNIYHASYEFHFSSSNDFVIPTANAQWRWYFSNLGNGFKCKYSHFANAFSSTPSDSRISFFKVDSSINHTRESSKYHTFWKLQWTGEALGPGDTYYTYYDELSRLEFYMLNTQGNAQGLNFDIERLKFTLTEYDDTIKLSNLFK